MIRTKTFILLSLLLFACGGGSNKTEIANESTLFKQVPSSITGVDFSNAVKATETFNLFSYMYFYNGGGVAAGDLNGDGLDDLYFTGNQVSNKLYLNQGEFSFIDITDKTQTGGDNKTWYTGVTFADVNGDGKLDIYVSQIGDILNIDSHNLLFINIGNDKDGIPQFKESAREFGLIVKGATTQTAFFDYDLDGDLDAYIMTHSNFNDGVLPKANKRSISSDRGDKLLRNDGEHFIDVTKESGIYSSNLGFGLGISTADINKDGYPDIYIGNDFYEDDYLYINKGDGTFTEDLESRIKHTSRFSMGNDVADLNNDKLPDILSLDMQPFMPEIIKASHGEDSYAIFNYKLSYGYQHQYAHNTFQLNRDGKHFSEIARLSGIEATDWSWSVLASDYDLDGRKDIFITNGIFRRSNDMDYMQFLSGNEVQKQLRSGNHNYSLALTEKMPSYPLKNFFFKNNGDLDFTDVSERWGSGESGFSNGATYTDLDNDGDLDLVVNNLNAQAQILRNTTIENKPANKGYIKIYLEGDSKNKRGLGAKVSLVQDGDSQYQELLNVRGYLSSSAPYLIFGVDSTKMIDTLKVQWPDETETILIAPKVNTDLVVRQSGVVPSPQDSKTNIETLFAKVGNDELGIDFKHHENRFYEFNREHLIPHANSTWGPALSVGDFNNDGLEDFFVGGAQNQPASLFIQQQNGTFKFSSQSALTIDAISEDTASSLFDANGDGFLDLLVGSGSNQEIKPESRGLTRLYLNDGKGYLKKDKNFPEIYSTVSDIAIADYDKDGDIDILITSRSVPGRYGAASDSYLLNNDGKGNFTLDSENQTLFEQIGMVTSAKWVDLNGNGWKDLVLVGEWMPIKIYYNTNGKLKESQNQVNGLQFSNGWWNTVEFGDFDNDGDIDLVAGNLGLNARLSASQKYPVKMYYADFDRNGWPEGITTHFMDGKEQIFSSKSLLEKQLVYLRKKFTSYSAFAKADLLEVFSKEELSKADVLKAYEFQTAIIENLGDDKFEIRPLPIEAQFSPVNTIKVLDIDGDQNLDLLFGENFYESNTELGRYDAGYGTLFKNDGEGNFNNVAMNRTGILLDGQLRQLKIIQNKKLGTLLIAGINNDSLQFYRFAHEQRR